MFQPTKVQAHPVRMLFTILGFIAVAALVTITFASGDVTWWMPGFDEKPGRIVVFNKGTQTEYREGVTGYEALANGVVQSLAKGAVRPSDMGLSPSSIDDARNLYVTVEAFFDHPVKLHSWFDTHNPTRMMFLITGRHSELSMVIMGNENQYFVNGPILNTREPLLQALKDLGYPTSD